jgi:predicted metal-dependent phosphoesterase TrpH
VDLHSHTIQSDGLLDPIELVRAAAAVGVRLFAITDHDTVSGVRALLHPNAEPLPAGLELIPGVEINAITPGDDPTPAEDDEVHIIGLGVDPANEAFEAVLAGQRAERRLRFGRIVERLRELGMPIDSFLGRTELRDDFALGRPTAARALVNAGHATSVEDAFAQWLGKGAPAFVARTGLDPVAAIRAIRAAGGLPVLAHFWAAGERIALVRELADAGLGGIEVHHWSFDQPTVESVGAVARELRLVPSGGTDYHGDLGTYADVHAGLWVPPEVGDAARTALGLAF